MIRSSKTLFVLLLLAFLAGCVGGTLPDPTSTNPSELVRLTAMEYTITGWKRPGNSPSARSPLWVVIEGDGARWGPRGTPPRDPTPRNAIGAKIAGAIPNSETVLYLARPCQFITSTELKSCNPAYWTDKRFNLSIIKSMASLIDTHKPEGVKVILIGFSGGGILAAELALRRRDIRALVTVASPLDLQRWTKVHKVSALRSPTPSLQLLSRLKGRDLAQLHLFGERDKVVPKQARERVIDILGPDQTRIIPDFSHNDRWSQITVSLALNLIGENTKLPKK